MGRDDFWYYPPATPRAVTGGIKAQNRRGAFAGKWWGKRWLETLESFNIGARLSRGRSYARSGQVTSLQIGKGSLTARVQGSRKTPYKVTIELKAFTAQQWQKILERLLDEPILAARLLGNELAEEMETVFREAGLPLFPKRQDDLVTDCSCPDWSNPCKHVAAVYYLLAEAFDHDPFLLFKLRGMERDEFLARLREAGGGPEAGTTAMPEPEPVPLPVDADAFWDGVLPPADAWRPPPPTLHAALPRRLGPLPFWRGNEPFGEAMTRLYRFASEAAVTHFSRLEEGSESAAPGDEPAASPAKPAPPRPLARRAQGRKTNPLTTNGGDAGAKGGRTGVSPPAKRGQAALAATNQPAPQRLLAAMEPARYYTRGELLAATGISEADWTWAIRQLKEKGQVVQRGERRGARYVRK